MGTAPALESRLEEEGVRHNFNKVKTTSSSLMGAENSRGSEMLNKILRTRMCLAGEIQEGV